MSYPNAIEVCRAELFTNEVELRERYPSQMIEKFLRVCELILKLSPRTGLVFPSDNATENSDYKTENH